MHCTSRVMRGRLSTLVTKIAAFKSEKMLHFVKSPQGAKIEVWHHLKGNSLPSSPIGLPAIESSWRSVEIRSDEIKLHKHGPPINPQP